MVKEEIINIVKKYADLINKTMNIKKVILYGSYARGNPRPDSDIDVAVVVDGLAEDFLNTEIQLYRLRRDLDDRIEPILINEKNDKSGFLEELLKTGTVVYSH